jgi:hypothetical protein
VPTLTRLVTVALEHESNVLRDLDANQLINACKDVSTDLSKIVPGCAV